MAARKTAGAPKKAPRRASHRVTPARETIAAAAAELGGVEALVAWVRKDDKNESVFWGSLFPKLIAVQLEGEEDAPVAQEIIVRFV